jgi:hypothetical protein
MHICLLALALLAAPVALASTPSTVAHQGRVLDASGAGVNGSVTLTFRVYAVPSSGAALWTEVHPGVVVSDGYFAVELGSVTDMPEDLFATGARYLGVQVGTGTELVPRTSVLTVPRAHHALALESAASAPLACDAPSHAGRAYFDTTLGQFRGCDGTSWGSLGGAPVGQVPSGGAGTAGDPGRSCLDIHLAYPNLGDGLYVVDPDGDGTTIQVQCDMTRAGGGWTYAVKSWNGSGVATQQGAVGSVGSALTHKGAVYKLDDQTVRDIIGPTNNFDVLGDQSGYNSTYSTGNYEYAVLRNYTAWWTFGGVVASSSTTTDFTSYRASDGAVAWVGNLYCGGDSRVGGAGAGINCKGVISGTNPNGGSGCAINMGTQSDPSWNHFSMSWSDTDTYLFLCNGPQHSSGHNMNHRWWIRERNLPTTAITLGTQADPARTCKDLHTREPALRDGIYWIDPEQDGGPIRVQCDMTRAGGGWTLGLKTWNGSGIAGATGAVGTVFDGLVYRNGLYKLADDDINDIIGPTHNFDVLGDQAGFNHTYSTGNYEHATVTNYTGTWTHASLMPESTTTTTFTSYRTRDGATAWTGRLACGSASGAGAAARGINCKGVISGTNPNGGSGCSINMGTQSDPSWNHFAMSWTDGDTYLFLCNGPQHSSGHNMNHRWWFRERN